MLFNSRPRSIVLLALLIPFALSPLSASDYDYSTLRQSAVAACDKIDLSKHETGLWMNPDGYRSFYVRSECLQNVAIQFRDQALCSQVRRRWSLYSSWGISTAQCRKLVNEHVAADRTELEQLKQAYAANSAMHLDSLRVERYGNARGDYDFLPIFSGSYAHGYTITLEILPPNQPAVLIHKDGYHIDSASNLRLFVRQADIRARFPDFQPNRIYQLRATVTLALPVGTMNGYWSDAFIEGIFPFRERSQSLTIEAEF
jgi:hypothetical protein